MVDCEHSSFVMSQTQTFTPFLMFVGEQFGKAEEAMNFYVSLFPNSAIVSVQRVEGAVQHATFTLDGQQFMAIDSGQAHDFTFTPALSIFVQCRSEQEIDGVFHALSSGGTVLMALDRYGFSEKFGWVQDRFGVSWQLNLDKK